MVSSQHLITVLFAVAVVVCTNYQGSNRQSLGDLSLNEKSAGSEQKDFRKPVYLQGKGTEGVNYFLDNSSRPYIMCDYYDVSACDPAVRDCPATKMCYASNKGHWLGCMAALVNNSSSRHVTLKGCWMHDENLGNCGSSSCVAEKRSTGSGNAAMFCCCNTHYCNRQVQFPPATQSTALPSDVPLVETEDSGLFTSDKVHAVAIVFAIFVVCMLVVFSYWTYREYRSNQLYKSKHADAFALAGVGGDVRNPLIVSSKQVDRGQITDLVEIARGRFGRVYRGILDGKAVAVKVFPKQDANSWIAEHEVYSTPGVQKESNILRFIGAEVHNEIYWLITEYHERGSLHDYLKYYVVSLAEALKVISTMLKGLSFLHEEKKIDEKLKPCIVHRDFKSRNVLLKNDLTAVISDFGLAMKCENGQMPADEIHNQVGTRRYMSPEVLEGATEFTAFAFRQIDVYAAALVMWEVLTRTKMCPDDCPTDYHLPYEEEAGFQPTLHDLRRIVAVQKIRPRIRNAVVENNIGLVLWKTVQDMWDKEPDGRITSGCAYERTNTLFLSYGKPNESNGTTPVQNYGARLTSQNPNPTSPMEQISLKRPVMTENAAVPTSFIDKARPPSQNGYTDALDEYGQSCVAVIPNVRRIDDHCETFRSNFGSSQCNNNCVLAFSGESVTSKSNGFVGPTLHCSSKSASSPLYNDDSKIISNR